MTSGNATVQTNTDFPGLDGLRAVGALAVLTTHVAFQTGEYYRHGTGGTVLARFDVGVAIFFVLSGFLLSRAWWARAALERPTPAVAPYARKRVLRIMPVYLLTAIAALVVVPDNDGRSAFSWLVTLVLGDTYVHQALPYALTHMWSLAVEVAFYAVLPVLMALIVRRGRLHPRRAAIALAVLVLINLGWITWAAPALARVVTGSPALWLPGYLSWFAAGMGAALVHVRHQGGTASAWGERLVRLGRQPGACWTAALGLLLVAATPIAGPVSLELGTIPESLVKNLLYAAIGLLLVMAGVWAPPGSTYLRLMSSRLVRHLGHISYSIFCVHLIVLELIQERIDYQLFTGDFPRIWLLTLGITIAVSEALYWLVERPFMRLAARRVPSDSVAHAARAASASSAK